MDLLANILTKRGVRKALERLPSGIDDTYTEAWSRISGQIPEQSELGKRVLSWAIHATRPLRVSEMQEALAIEEGDELLDQEWLFDAARLTWFYAGLVMINEQRQLITLIHPTTQEYFNARKNAFFLLHMRASQLCVLHTQA